MVVSCKSWQTGFNPRKKLTELREKAGRKKRPTWHHFRELWIPKWADAFGTEIRGLTGVDQFTYRIAITRFQGGEPARWAKEWDSDATIHTTSPDAPSASSLLKRCGRPCSPNCIGHRPRVRLADLLNY